MYGNAARGAVAVACLTLAGCASMPSGGSLAAQSASIYDHFMGPSKFREQVAAGQWAQADATYARLPDLLAKETPKEVERLAQHDNDTWAPRLVAASTTLTAAIEATPFDPDTLSKAVTGARDVMGEYSRNPLLAAPSRQSDQYRRLAAVAESAQKSVEARLPGLMATWPHATAPILAEKLPWTPDPAALRAAVAPNTGVLAEAIKAAPEPKALALFRAYRPFAAAPDALLLERALLSSVVRTRFPGGQPLTFAQLVEAGSAVRQAGAANSPIRAVSLAADGPDSASAVKVELDGAALESKPVASLPAELKAAAASGQPYVMVVDATRTARVSQLGNPHTITRKKEAGKKSVPNPAYAQAQSDLSTARSEYSRVVSEDSRLQTQATQLAQMGGGKNRFMAALGSAQGSLAVNLARERVSHAEEMLRNTPRTLQETTYVDETVPVASVQEETIGDVGIYVADSTESRIWAIAQPIDHDSLSKDDVELAGLPTQSQLNRVSPSPVKVSLSTADIAASVDKASPATAVKLKDLVAKDRSGAAAAAVSAKAAALKASDETRAQLLQLSGKGTAGSALQAGGRGAASSGGRTGSAANSCPQTLAHLDSKLPNYAIPELQATRAERLQMSVGGAIAQAKGQGIGIDEMVDKSFQQADLEEDAMRQAAQSVVDVDAAGLTTDDVIRGAKDGSLANATNCTDGIRSAALCAVATEWLNTLAYRGLAAALQCHAKLEQH